MKRRTLKKKANRVFGKDKTYNKIIVYFYKEIVDNGHTFFVYTAKPKNKGSFGTYYRYIMWLKHLNFYNME